MKKLFTKCASVLALCALTLTSYSTAYAFSGTITSGVPINIDAFDTFNGNITVSSAGTLKVQLPYSLQASDFLVNDPSDNPVSSSGTSDGGSYQEVSYPLATAGTYNCQYDGFIMDACTITVTFEAGSGGGDGGNTGGGSTDRVLPVPTSNFTLSQNYYTYTPSENGVLTITYNQPPYDNNLYRVWVDNHGDSKVTTKDPVNTDTAVTYTWSLSGGHTYYLDSSYPSNAVVTTSFAPGGNGDPEVGGGGDVDPNPGPGGDDSGYTAVELGKTYEIADGETLAVYYTPTSNGTLKISQWGSSDPYLFLAPTENPEDYANAVSGDYVTVGEEPNEYFVFSFNVTAGTTYYYYGVHDNAKWLELSKVIFEFEGTGGGNDNPSQPGEIPAGYTAMEMKSYSVTGVGSVMLAFIPASSGMLTVTQTGSYDGHLFNVQPELINNNYEAQQGKNQPMESQGGTYQGENPYTLKYGVAAGVTYYYVGKLSTGDSLSAVEFAFQAASNDNTIELDTPYVVNTNSPIYSFTPDETGILTVAWSNPTPGGEPALTMSIVWGSSQYFLYSNYGCTEAMPMLESEAVEDVGYKVKFNVVKGQTYYLHLDDLNKWQCVFSMEAGELRAASIKTIEPVPGTAFDPQNFPYYWNLILSPNEPTLEKVTLTYVPANDPNGTSTTIDVTAQYDDETVFPPFEFGGDAMRISTMQLVSLLNNNEIADNTDIVYTLYGVKAAGEYVTQNLMAQGDDYVTIDENGLVTVTFTCGEPIKLLTQNWPDPFLSGWERGDKAGIATLTYDGPIYHVGAVTVTQGHQIYGSTSSGDTPPYSVTVPQQKVTWEGNTVTIDFTGINYNMPSGTKEVTIAVSGPMGQNGLAASYDGVPVLQHYATFTTDGAVVIPESIINYIEPRDGVTFSGLSEGEVIEITLMDNVKESTESLTGVLSEEDGEVLGTFGFIKAAGDRWIYELEEGENYPFAKDQTYLFTVTAMGASNQTLGSEVVYWYGNGESGAAAIGADKADNVIYTLSGVRVNTSDVNALSNGLYIINGKKVLIRK